MLSNDHVLTKDLITILASLTRDGAIISRFEFGTDLHLGIMTTCYLLLRMEELS